MLKSVLIKREYQVPGNWYAPLEKIREFKSVVKSDLWDTCSSAGDWSGWLLQKIGSVYYLIPWWQSNNWPRGGFTLATNDRPFAEFNYLPDLEEIYQILSERSL